MNSYRFGPFELDPGDVSLSRNGKAVKLQDLPFRLLLMLVERPGEIVSRDEVRNRIWPENTFVEFDNNLGVAIRKVREALGDSAEAPVYVATIPRRGYRFLAPVAQILQEPADATPTLPASPLVENRPSAQNRSVSAVPALYVAAAGIFLLLGCGFAVWLHAISKRTPQRPVEANAAVSAAPLRLRRSVAVLGFRNLTNQTEDNWLSPVFSEMLDTELGVSGDIRMVSGEDVARAKRELPLTDQESLGRATLQRLRTNPGADVVLLGSYLLERTHGRSEIRLDLRLQDTASGETIAENSVTGDENDLLALTAEAGSSLRDGLGVKTRPGSETKLRAALPSSQATTRLYAEGRARTWSFDFQGARDLLVKATAADPNFPLAHSALSEALWHLGYNLKARQEAKRAVELSSGLPQEDRLLIEGQYRRSLADWPGAVASYQGLFNMYPDSLDYGLLLASAQTYVSHASALQTLATLRRLPPPAGNDARIDMEEASAWIGQDLGKARAAARRAIAKGTAQGSHAIVGRTYGILCQQSPGIGAALDEAISDCEEARQSSLAAGNRNGEAMMLTNLGALYFQRGNLTRCEEMFRTAIVEFQKVGNPDGTATAMSNLAGTMIAAGDMKGARRLMEDATPEYEAIQDKEGVALNLDNLGDLERQTGNLAVAETTYHQAKATAEEIDDKSAIGYALNGMGDLLTDRGELKAARDSYEAALKLRKQLGEKETAGETEVSLAALSIEEGHPADAEVVLRKESEQFAQEKQADDELIARTFLIDALQAQGKNTEAQTILEASRALAKQSQSLYAQLQFNLRAASIASAMKDNRTAKQDIDRLLADSRKHGYVGIHLAATLAMTVAEEASGNPEQTKRQRVLLQNEARSKGFGLIARKAGATS